MMFDPMSYEIPGKRQRPQGFWRFRFLGLFILLRSSRPSLSAKAAAHRSTTHSAGTMVSSPERAFMRADLSVRAVHRGSMRVDVHVRDHVLAMDYPAEPGKAPTPLEVLMASLAACAANTLNLVLCRKM